MKGANMSNITLLILNMLGFITMFLNTLSLYNSYQVNLIYGVESMIDKVFLIFVAIITLCIFLIFLIQIFFYYEEQINKRVGKCKAEGETDEQTRID